MNHKSYRFSPDKFSTALANAQMTESDVSRSLGISRQAVNLWCEGLGSPRSDVVISIAHLLKVRTEDLFEDALAVTVQYRFLARDLVGAMARQRLSISELARQMGVTSGNARLMCDILRINPATLFERIDSSSSNGGRHE